MDGSIYLSRQTDRQTDRWDGMEIFELMEHMHSITLCILNYNELIAELDYNKERDT